MESVLPKVNVGIVLFVIVTVKLVGKAHKPASGVKVYTPEAWLSTTAGFQTPFIALDDKRGKVGTPPPAHIAKAVPKLNEGTMLGATETLNTTGNAHIPLSGVKVYASLAVLLTTAGLQVPAIPLSEIAGNAGTVPPSHIDKLVPNANCGITFGVTTRSKLVVVAHCPVDGVNV